MHLPEYIDQTQLEHFPFIKKMNLTYLESFFESELKENGNPVDSVLALRKLALQLDPDGSNVFLAALSSKAVSYINLPYRDALVYGLKHNNVRALQLAADMYNLGTLVKFFGPSMSSSPQGGYTDMNPLGYTDTGLLTDIESGKIPVIVLQLDYTDFKTYDLGVPVGYDQAKVRFAYCQDLLQLIKPASRALFLTPRYNICLANVRGTVITTTGTGVHTGTANMPNYNEVMSITSQLDNAYTRLGGSYQWKLLYKETTDKIVKRIWEVYSNTHYISIPILSDTAGLPNTTITVEPTLDKIQSVRICFCYTKGTTDDITFQEVLYRNKDFEV